MHGRFGDGVDTYGPEESMSLSQNTRSDGFRLSDALCCVPFSLAGLSFHSHASGRRQGRSAAPQPCTCAHSGSSRNPIVMSVAGSARSPDPFLLSAAEWPANSTRWDEVSQVSEAPDRFWLLLPVTLQDNCSPEQLSCHVSALPHQCPDRKASGRGL